jgi:misacylated tRNA(Ala) deacylase
MKDPYIQEFDATVQSVKDDKFVVLDQTAFYPNSGGQPYDTGVLIRDRDEFPIVFVGKFGDIISHEIGKPGLRLGDKVKGKINWERRYLFMRYHTAAHILSTVIHNETGAAITGNQIAEDKTRIDFDLEQFDREKLKSYEEKANHVISLNIPVTLRFLPRDEAMKIPSVVKLAKGLPESIRTIRIVDIQGFDQQACGGCHIKNTSEIKGIQIVKAENKGKNNRRVYYTLKN